MLAMCLRETTQGGGDKPGIDGPFDLMAAVAAGGGRH